MRFIRNSYLYNAYSKEFNLVKDVNKQKEIQREYMRDRMYVFSLKFKKADD